MNIFYFFYIIIVKKYSKCVIFNIFFLFVLNRAFAPVSFGPLSDLSSDRSIDSTLGMMVPVKSRPHFDAMCGFLTSFRPQTSHVTSARAPEPLKTRFNRDLFFLSFLHILKNLWIGEPLYDSFYWEVRRATKLTNSAWLNAPQSKLATFQPTFCGRPFVRFAGSVIRESDVC